VYDLEHTIDHNGRHNRAGYIFVDGDGNILTDISDRKSFKWTPPALFEEEGLSALIFRNPHQIPLRLRSVLTGHHLVFRVHVPEGTTKADIETVLEADLVGAYEKAQEVKIFAFNGSQDVGVWRS